VLSDLLAVAAAASPAELVAALSTMSDADRAAIYRDAVRSDMAAYVRHLELGFEPAAHHLLLIRELQGVERGTCDRLMVCMPPGSAKSTYTSAIFPAWYLGRHPDRNVIAVSHTHDLAATFGRRVRNTFASPEHGALFGCGVASDSKAADDWATTRSGGYYATGVGGSVTGRRADLGIIDDPVKSREDADSDRSREKVWEWYVNDFKTRLKPGAAQILVMTRWHEDDLGGRVLQLEGDRWRVVKLPMEAGINDPLGREPGARLWPEWFTAEMMEDAKRDVRVWNALYQQEPAGEDGDYFKRDWFRVADNPPSALTIYGASDYAVTEGGGDFTEHGIFGIDAWANIYIIDWWRGQAASDEWIEAQCDLILRHKPACWFGESGPIRRAIEPVLIRRMEERRAFCRLEWLSSIADKAARCRPFQALAASGKIFIPYLASWKADVIGQLLRFPAGMHDDAVDVCSLIGRGLEYVRAPALAERILQTRANIGYASAKRRYGRR
jgi:predicted phage terminase large subunit-like protein